MGNIALSLLFQILLISLNAVFACAEIAVLSVNETKLEKLSSEGNKKAKRIYKLTRDPAKFLATIQVAITLSGFLGSAFAAENFSEPLVNWIIGLGANLPKDTLNAIAVVVITLILSYITLIFGELVPKRIAMKKSEGIAMGLSGTVRFISIIFKPIVWLLSISTNLVLRIFGIDPNEVEEEVDEEDIKMMVDAGTEQGTIEHEEKELIKNIFEFNDITAKDILTHRTDVNILWLEDNEQTWEETIHKSRHTLYPVCGDTADNVIGVLNAKDYFRLEDRSHENVMKNAIHPAYFIPETIKADVLFKNMKSSRNSLAIVMDEYGGMEGIVTLFDLIEELVGDLNEENDEEDIYAPEIQKISEDTWKVTGNISLEELEETLEIDLENEEFDTLTGLVFNELGIIPDDGESSIEILIDKIKVKVNNIDAHQIVDSIITLVSQGEQDANRKDKRDKKDEE